ncbi:hypothetical protein D6D08_10030 [Aureobasidium pullulans]|nr:hypothetical protein D6D08_10030 [Aureobasidium pullulans]
MVAWVFSWTLMMTGLFDEMNDRLDQKMIDMLEPSPDDGNTALHWLVKSILRRPILTQSILRKFLVIGDVGCSPQNLIRDTPLHVAIAADHVTLARMLIQNGAVFPTNMFKLLPREKTPSMKLEGQTANLQQDPEISAPIIPEIMLQPGWHSCNRYLKIIYED